MNGSVTISAERIDDTLKAKQNGQYIMVAPGKAHAYPPLDCPHPHFHVLGEELCTLFLKCALSPAINSSQLIPVLKIIPKLP